jgi:hypothetical protein
MQPEKLVIFGPLIIFFLFFGALVFGFLFVVVKLVLKGKNSAWKGEIIDKKHNSRDDDGRDEHFYSLVIKTDDGKNIKLGISAKQYQEYQIGDKLEKKKGSIWPVKIS